MVPPAARRLHAITCWSMVLIPAVTALPRQRFWGEPSLAGAWAGLSENASETLTGYLSISAQVWWLLLALAGAMLLRRRPPGPEGRALWLASLAPWAALLLAGIFGTSPGLPPGMAVWPVLLTTLWLGRQDGMRDALGPLRDAMRVFCLANFAAVLLFPAWTLEPDYITTIIPSFPWRLHGLANHANALGPTLALGVLVELIAAPRRGRLAFVLLLGALLLMSQSKTSLVAFALAVPMPLLALLHARTGIRPAPAVTVAILAWCLLTALAALAVAGSMAVHTGKLPEEQLETLTGRTEIWRLILGFWKENPIFGFGPGLFDAGMQETYQAALGWQVHHSHNQFVDLLGKSGLIGLFAWILLVATMVWSAARRPDSLARTAPLIVLMLVSSMSEPWFTHFTFVDRPWLLILLMALHAEAAASTGEPAPAEARCAS